MTDKQLELKERLRRMLSSLLKQYCNDRAAFQRSFCNLTFDATDDFIMRFFYKWADLDYYPPGFIYTRWMDWPKCETYHGPDSLRLGLCRAHGNQLRMFD